MIEALVALMELAYRLAIDDSPYIKYIRSHMIVLITPVVEVDGRDRQVDVYKWHRAHPDLQYPRLVYWGHYVAHDSNRDAMGMTLNLRAAGTQSPSLSRSPSPGKLARSTKSSCATTPA